MNLNLNLRTLKNTKGFHDIKVLTLSNVEIYYLNVDVNLKNDDALNDEVLTNALAYKVLDTDLLMVNKNVDDALIAHLIVAFDFNKIPYALFVPAGFEISIRILLFEQLFKDDMVRHTCEGFTDENKGDLRFKFFDFNDEEQYEVKSINFPLGKKDGLDILIKRDKHFEYRSIKEGNLIQEL